MGAPGLVQGLRKLDLNGKNFSLKVLIGMLGGNSLGGNNGNFTGLGSTNMSSTYGTGQFK
jgi:hypothetical protein